MSSKLELKHFVEKNLNISGIFNEFTNENELAYINKYYNNSIADAEYTFKVIQPYLDKKKKILEIGGGIHLLSYYLDYLGYDIISLEPGGFGTSIDKFRKKILSQNPSDKLITQTLEEFRTAKKFDFIFSINVLEHVRNINKHLLSATSKLKDKNSFLYIRCPNYSFPYESHFKVFFIPYFPELTLNKILKKKLIKIHGEKRYYNLINNINFNCTYKNIKALKLKSSFENPIIDIFKRIENDFVFKKRILQNKKVYLIYRILNFKIIRKIFVKIFPKSINPYIILMIKGDF